MSPLVALALAAAAFISSAAGYGSGPPCGTEHPSHGGSAQGGSAPYSVDVAASCYTPGSPLSVTISGGRFKGYRLATVSSGSGDFESTSDGRVCSDGKSATHSNARGKDSVTVQFVPADRGGSVQFKATIVQGYSTYWVDVRSGPVPKCAGGGGGGGDSSESDSDESGGGSGSCSSPPPPTGVWGKWCGGSGWTNVWYYDSSRRTCSSFWWGGCDIDTDNRFSSEALCKDACL